MNLIDVYLEQLNLNEEKFKFSVDALKRIAAKRASASKSSVKKTMSAARKRKQAAVQANYYRNSAARKAKDARTMKSLNYT